MRAGSVGDLEGGRKDRDGCGDLRGIVESGVGRGEIVKRLGKLGDCGGVSYAVGSLEYGSALGTMSVYSWCDIWD